MNSSVHTQTSGGGGCPPCLSPVSRALPPFPGDHTLPLPFPLGFKPGESSDPMEKMKGGEVVQRHPLSRPLSAGGPAPRPAGGSAFGYCSSTARAARARRARAAAQPLEGAGRLALCALACLLLASSRRSGNPQDKHPLSFMERRVGLIPLAAPRLLSHPLCFPRPRSEQWKPQFHPCPSQARPSKLLPQGAPSYPACLRCPKATCSRKARCDFRNEPFLVPWISKAIRRSAGHRSPSLFVQV